MCLILLKSKLCYQKFFSVFNQQTIGRVDEIKISVHELICCKITNKKSLFFECSHRKRQIGKCHSFLVSLNEATNKLHKIL